MATDNTKGTDQGLTASDNAIQIFQQNPGVAFSLADLKAIHQDTLVPVPPFHKPPHWNDDRWIKLSCITQLRFQNGDDDLAFVRFESGYWLNTAKAKNLNDFRQTFLTAANHGFGVTGCLDTVKKRLFMVNLHPCRCDCDDKISID